MWKEFIKLAKGIQLKQAAEQRLLKIEQVLRSDPNSLVKELNPPQKTVK